MNLCKLFTPNRWIGPDDVHILLFIYYLFDVIYAVDDRIAKFCGEINLLTMYI